MGDSHISNEPQKPEDDARPADSLDDEQGARGGLKPEKVEDRPSVGTVTPDDYPDDLPDH